MKTPSLPKAPYCQWHSFVWNKDQLCAKKLFLDFKISKSAICFPGRVQVALKQNRPKNKLEHFQDAQSKSSKTSTHNMEKHSVWQKQIISVAMLGGKGSVPPPRRSALVTKVPWPQKVLRHSHLLSSLAFGSVKKLTTSLSRGAQGCLFWPILKIDQGGVLCGFLSLLCITASAKLQFMVWGSGAPRAPRWWVGDVQQKWDCLLCKR